MMTTEQALHKGEENFLLRGNSEKTNECYELFS